MLKPDLKKEQSIEIKYIIKQTKSPSKDIRFKFWRGIENKLFLMVLIL